jgi:hypothetical protein
MLFMRVKQIRTFSFHILKILFNRFYCDSSSNLDEHNQTHTLPKSVSIEELPLPISAKPSELLNNANSEKSTPSNKTKVHRCRQCSYISSVKVKNRFQKIRN